MKVLRWLFPHLTLAILAIHFQMAAKVQAGRPHIALWASLGVQANVYFADTSMMPAARLIRISTATGTVTRTPLYEAGNMDHPKVNPNFYSRPTRFVWFNGAAQPLAEAGASGPPQVVYPTP